MIVLPMEMILSSERPLNQHPVLVCLRIRTISKKNLFQLLLLEGRHDVCIAIRIPVVIECATAIVLADLLLQKHGGMRNKITL